jgi:hypothetical protein
MKMGDLLDDIKIFPAVGGREITKVSMSLAP